MYYCTSPVELPVLIALFTLLVQVAPVMQMHTQFSASRSSICKYFLSNYISLLYLVEGLAMWPGG